MADEQHVLERGDIQFFFRPSVQPAEADEYKLGVQSFFAILSVAGRDFHRRLRVGKKRMPVAPRERFWARIERTGTLDRVLGGSLESDYYTTKTRGERFQPAARPIASGEYAFVQHADHVHFTYRVQPFGFEDAPDEIAVAETGNHLVLFEATEGKATWSHRGTIALLDDDGAELVLVGSCSLVDDVLSPAADHEGAQ